MDPSQVQHRRLAHHAGPGQHHRLRRRGRLAPPGPRGHVGQGVGQAAHAFLQRHHGARLRGRPPHRGDGAVETGAGGADGGQPQQVGTRREPGQAGLRVARTLFVTGKLAAPALRATLAAMAPPFEYDVAVLRITVAALMTTGWIARHLGAMEGYDRILIPGLCEGDPRVIEDRVGVRAGKGPADLRDLPEYFGGAALREEYGAYDIRIFAEINNVPYLSREEVLRRAQYFRESGADVIDLGCSLDRKLDDAAELVGLLKDRGAAVSIDTFDKTEILAADRAGVATSVAINRADTSYRGALDLRPDDAQPARSHRDHGGAGRGRGKGDTHLLLLPMVDGRPGHDPVRGCRPSWPRRSWW